MQGHFPAALTETAEAPALAPVNLVGLNARELAQLLVGPPPQLLVDCSRQLIPHPLGVCRFVAQLLQMRRRGTSIWLCNVHPGLQYCLGHLNLTAVFPLNG